VASAAPAKIICQVALLAVKRYSPPLTHISSVSSPPMYDEYGAGEEERPGVLFMHQAAVVLLLLKEAVSLFMHIALAREKRERERVLGFGMTLA
jgi:hypothetical protein